MSGVIRILSPEELFQMIVLNQPIGHLIRPIYEILQNSPAPRATATASGKIKASTVSLPPVSSAVENSSNRNETAPKKRGRPPLQDKLSKITDKVPKRSKCESPEAAIAMKTSIITAEVANEAAVVVGDDQVVVEASNTVMSVDEHHDAEAEEGQSAPLPVDSASSMSPKNIFEILQAQHLPVIAFENISTAETEQSTPTVPPKKRPGRPCKNALRDRNSGNEDEFNEDENLTLAQVKINESTENMPGDVQEEKATETVLCHRCEAVMRPCTRKLKYNGTTKVYETFRCGRKGCQTFRSPKFLQRK